MLFENSKNVRGLYSTESLSCPQQRIGNGQLLEEYSGTMDMEDVGKISKIREYSRVTPIRAGLTHETVHI